MSREKPEVRRVTLRDGEPVLLRTLQARDRELIVESFERLSEHSRYQRFFLRLRRLPESVLDALLDVDHHDREAITAISPITGQLLGVARYGRSPEHPATADLAVSVADDWQGRGLGSLLLDRLVERAREEGVARFSATVLGDNPEALALLSRLGTASHRVEHGVVELLVELPRDRGVGPRLASMLRALAIGALRPARTLAEHLAVELTPAPGRPVAPGERIRTIVVRAAPDDLPTMSAAIRLAVALGANLHVLCGGTSQAARRLLERERRTAGAEALRVELHRHDGDPAAALVLLAQEQRADLIVVGAASAASSRSPKARRAADWVSHHAGCSVLLIYGPWPPPERRGGPVELSSRRGAGITPADGRQL